MNEITYSRVNDYDLPDLTLPEQQDIFVGKYGLLRKNYLKTHRKIAYTNLLTLGKLQEHLADVDQEANDRLRTIVSQAAERQNITEALKATDQMAWVGAMNNIKHQAEEIIVKELIYA
jgi:hypothetical protein